MLPRANGGSVRGVRYKGTTKRVKALAERGTMATIDIIVSIASIVAAGVVIALTGYLANHSGRDRPHDPERLRRFIANAPYDRLRKPADERAQNDR